MKHEYMPISITMTGRRCLVVGGGPVALRKVEGLIDYDTEVTVVAPEVLSTLADHAQQGRITHGALVGHPQRVGGEDQYRAIAVREQIEQL